MERETFIKRNKKLLFGLLKLIIFIVCLVFVLNGHHYGRLHMTVIGGLTGLGLMMLGLVGIIILLYTYNKKYR